MCVGEANGGGGREGGGGGRGSYLPKEKTKKKRHVFQRNERGGAYLLKGVCMSVCVFV